MGCSGALHAIPWQSSTARQPDFSDRSLASSSISIMLVLLPVFLLLFTALALLVLQQVRPGFGYAWLAATGLSLATWGFVLAFHFRPVPPFVVMGWLPVEGLAPLLTFQVDAVSWPYAFALVSLLVAVILTAAARMQLRTGPTAWAGSLAITGAGLLAILAGDLLTLIAAWTLIDIIELSVILLSGSGQRQPQQAVISFAARVTGTFVAVVAFLYSASQGVALTFTDMVPEAGLFLLVAAGLRLGVVPLHLPYSQEVRMRRGLGTILRLVAPASALPLLSRLPQWVAPPGWSIFLLVFSALAAVYGSGMWLAGKDELNARPYWLISLAGMAVASSLRGHPRAALAWGLALLLSGGVIFLYSARPYRFPVILLLGGIGLSGLPFTPSSGGWAGLVVPPFNLLDMILIFAHSLLLLGFLRFALAERPLLVTSERWVQVMYPFGLLILIAAQWLIGVFGWPNSLAAGVWWGAVASTALAAGLLFGFQRLRQIAIVGGRLDWLALVGGRVGHGLSAFLRLDWLYRFLWLVYGLVQSLVRFLTTILEGGGGLLWALLLLALLATLLKAGGVS